MSIIDIFRRPRRSTAIVAKERLLIVISHERTRNNNADLLQTMQQELLDVVAKYLKVDKDKIREQVKVDLDKRGDHAILELNITLPDTARL